MLLLKNARVYSPAYLGIKDIFVEGTKILRIEENIEISGFNSDELEVFDCEGKILTPGFIDLHTHIIGGGGEDGPSSMVPECKVTDFFKAGVSTTLGLLGTDGIVRTPEMLLAKCKSLRESGLSCYTLTGSYMVPSVTVLGDIERDITLIEEMIGVKVALSDHRGSNPSKEDLISLITKARRGGLLGKKAGLVTIHMGLGKKGLLDIFEILNSTDIPIKNILPTHMGYRNPELKKQGMEFMKLGGTIDISARESEESNETIYPYIKEALEKGYLSQITISSDAFGSLPKFDENGNCIGLIYATPQYILDLLEVLKKNGLKLEEILTMVTSNPARVMGLGNKKGTIKKGFDADLLLLEEDLKVNSLITMGSFALKKGLVLKKGRFE